MPGWIVSPRWRKRYMTAPQDSAAKTVKYFESGGIGCTLEAERDDPPDLWYGWFPRGRKEANTLEMTYSTICKDVLFHEGISLESEN